jgi:hypothetical protein
VIHYHVDEPRTLGLAAEELDALWLATAGEGPKRYRRFAEAVERELASRGVGPHTLTAGAVFKDSAKLRGWGGRACARLVQLSKELGRLGYSADAITALVAEYLASWGPEVRQ